MGAACCGNKNYEIELNGTKICSNKIGENNSNYPPRYIEIIQRVFRIYSSKKKLNTIYNDYKDKVLIELDKKRLMNCNLITDCKSEKYYQELIRNDSIKSFLELIDDNNKMKTKLNSIEKFSFYVPYYIVISSNEVYIGSWNSNKNFNGYGIKYEFDNKFNKDSRTEGIFIEGYLDGPGRIIFSDKELIIGNFKYNKLKGYGEYHRNDGSIYKGSFDEGLPHGNGKEEFYDGSFFEGFYLNGKKKYGIFEWKDGSKYQGDFENDLFNGKGLYIWNSNKKYDGNWKDGKMEGIGKLTYVNGSFYEGEFVNGKKCGKGKYFWNKDKYYDGYWKNEKQNGFGIYYKSGKIIKGIWSEGKLISNCNNGRKNLNLLNNCKTMSCSRYSDFISQNVKTISSKKSEFKDNSTQSMGGDLTIGNHQKQRSAIYCEKANLFKYIKKINDK